METIKVLANATHENMLDIMDQVVERMLETDFSTIELPASVKVTRVMQDHFLKTLARESVYEIIAALSVDVGDDIYEQYEDRINNLAIRFCDAFVLAYDAMKTRFGADEARMILTSSPIEFHLTTN